MLMMGRADRVVDKGAARESGVGRVERARDEDGRTRVNWLGKRRWREVFIDGICGTVFPRAGSREHHIKELRAFLCRAICAKIAIL